MTDQDSAHAFPAGALWHSSLSEHKTRQSEHIVHAALTVAGDVGTTALSMSAIAEAAGISRQTLYKYFADVEAVLKAAAERVGRMDEHFVEIVTSESDSFRQLEIFVNIMLEAAREGHPSSAMMEAALPLHARRALEAHAGRVEELVIEIMRRGRGDGSFRSDLEPDIDGRIVYRTVVGSQDLASRAGNDLPRLISHTVSAVRRMVV